MQKTSTEILIFIATTTAIILMLLAIILSILYSFRRKQQIFIKEMEELKLDHEKKILNTQLEIQENTFRHISREIHDNISLSLTLAKLYLNTANINNTKKMVELINLSEGLITSAMSGLRNISAGLNADNITRNGLIGSINEEIEKLNKVGVYQLNFTVSGNPVFLSTQKEVVIFRIIQESLNNIIKHSYAKKIGILLFYQGNHVEVTITDDGIGFITEDNSNIKNDIKSGLINMCARSRMFNGDCKIESAPGKGSSVFVTIPYQEEYAK